RTLSGVGGALHCRWRARCSHLPRCRARVQNQRADHRRRPRPLCRGAPGVRLHRTRDRDRGTGALPAVASGGTTMANALQALGKSKVRDLMTSAVRTLRRNDELSIADDLMSSNRIRHLPVLDEDGLVCGVVSQRDLFRGALVKALGYGTSAQKKVLTMLV